MKKMTFWEKILDVIALLIILFSIVVRCLWGVKDTGVLVILAFMGILLYIIFLVGSCFPAHWRMTDKQKAKIKDMKIYQEKYRKIFVLFTFALAVFSAILIITCA